jgi:hypothetical protein
MLRSVLMVSASVFILILFAPAGSYIGPDLAFGIGPGGGAGGTGGVGGGAGGVGGGAGGVGGAAGGAAGAAGGAAAGAAGGLGGAAGGGGSSAGAGAAAASGSVSAQGSGRSDGRDNTSLAAFIASPVFTHVGPAVSSTVKASSVYTARGGIACQTMTQTIDIGGQTVHASAVLCRGPDGIWRIDPMQDAAAKPGFLQRSGTVVQ